MEVKKRYTLIPILAGLDIDVNELYSCAQNNKLIRLGVKIDTSKLCNWRCPYCYVSDESHNADFSDQKNCGNFTQTLFQRLLSAKEIGLRAITINGTYEPLTSRNLKKIVTYCCENDINVTVVTNATLLTKDLAMFLNESGVSILTKLNVPFVDDNEDDYHRVCEIQKKLSGRKGDPSDIYQEQIQRIEMLIEMGFNSAEVEGKTRLGIETIISKANLSLIPKLVRQCRMRNIYSHVEVMKIQGGGKQFQEFQITKNELYRLFSSILENDINDGYEPWVPKPPYAAGTCYQNLARLDLLENGVIMPCPGISLILGDLNIQSFQEIIQNDSLNIIRNLEKYIQGDCKHCIEFVTRRCYGGCRGTVYQTMTKAGRTVFESLVASDPSCYKVNEVLDDGTLSNDLFP